MNAIYRMDLSELCEIPDHRGHRHYVSGHFGCDACDAGLNR